MQGQTNHWKKLFNLKVLVSLMAMVLVVSYFSFSASVVKVNKEGYSVVAQKVHVSSSTKAKTLGSLKTNQTVYIYAHKGSWSQIKYGKTKGWVAKKNLKLGKPVVTINKDGHVKSNQYVYTSQNTKSKRLATVKKNQNVYILAQQGGWYKVKFGKATGWVIAKHFKAGKYVPPVVKVNKDGHALSNQYVYTSQNTKSKRLATVKKYQNVYVVSSQSGWYQVKFGKTTGWVIAKHFKPEKFVPKTSGGMAYPDGWTVPVLKSAWSSNHATNLVTLQNELGFKDSGRIFALPEYPQGVIHVSGQGGKTVDITFFGWEDTSVLPTSYRVPIVAKELFKLYFGGESTKVWNYFNSNDIPDSFTANGFNVKAVYSSSTGGITLMLR